MLLEVVTMFQAAAKTSSVCRGILLCIRHYSKKTPTKLRVSEAISGAGLGGNVKVQVKLTPMILYLMLICA